MMIPPVFFGVRLQVPLGLDLDRLLWTVAQAGETAMATDSLLPYRPAIDHLHFAGETNPLADTASRTRFVTVELEGTLNPSAEPDEVWCQRVEERDERDQE